jgi:hypothetical protein
VCGMIDPRGVVHSEDKTYVDPETKIKHYKVRNWRLCGESGKQYHQAVVAERKRRHNEDHGSTKNVAPQHSTKLPTLVTEDVELSWQSPISGNTRKYQFRYLDLDFYWKGTGTVREASKWRFLVHFNHLKLVVRIPVPDEGKKDRVDTSLLYTEICLAKYTSAVSSKKAGQLEILDEALSRLLDTHSGVEDCDGGEFLKKNIPLPYSVKQTRLHEVVVATAICMIVAESQKRQTLAAIVDAVQNGAANAG